MRSGDYITLNRQTYCLDALLSAGAGSYGQVWAATDPAGRAVALKFINTEAMAQADPTLRGHWREHLQREIDFLQSLDAARARHIVTLVDHGQADGQPVLALERMQGHLGQFLDTQTPDLERILDWAGQILAGLEVIHAAGFVYRDLKFSNILVGEDGALLKLADFGSLRREDGDSTRSFIGTPATMAPEQVLPVDQDASGYAYEVDFRADYYALGLLLFILLTGEPSTAAQRRLGQVLAREGQEGVARQRAQLGGLNEAERALLQQATGRWIATPGAASAQLVRLIEDLLASDPAERPADGALIRQALRDLHTELLPVPAPVRAEPALNLPEDLPVPPPYRRRARPTAAAHEPRALRRRGAGLIALLGMAGALAWAVIRPGPFEPPQPPGVPASHHAASIPVAPPEKPGPAVVATPPAPPMNPQPAAEPVAPPEPAVAATPPVKTNATAEPEPPVEPPVQAVTQTAPDAAPAVVSAPPVDNTMEPDAETPTPAPAVVTTPARTPARNTRTTPAPAPGLTAAPTRTAPAVTVNPRPAPEAPARATSRPRAAPAAPETAVVNVNPRPAPEAERVPEAPARAAPRPRAAPAAPETAAISRVPAKPPVVTPGTSERRPAPERAQPAPPTPEPRIAAPRPVSQPAAPVARTTPPPEPLVTRTPAPRIASIPPARKPAPAPARPPVANVPPTHLPPIELVGRPRPTVAQPPIELVSRSQRAAASPQQPPIELVSRSQPAPPRVATAAPAPAPVRTTPPKPEPPRDPLSRVQEDANQAAASIQREAGRFTEWVGRTGATVGNEIQRGLDSANQAVNNWTRSDNGVQVERRDSWSNRHRGANLPPP
jgi:serine/threonine-protein kinase